MRDAGILDGDLLAVKKASEAPNGKIVVARLGEDVTVKRLKKRGDTIELIAENPDFENIVLHSGRDEFSLEGIAVGLIRSSGF
jgi:repressor LexA